LVDAAYMLWTSERKLAFVKMMNRLFKLVKNITSMHFINLFFNNALDLNGHETFCLRVRYVYTTRIC